MNSGSVSKNLETYPGNIFSWYALAKSVIAMSASLFRHVRRSCQLCLRLIISHALFQSLNRGGKRL